MLHWRLLRYRTVYLARPPGPGTQCQPLIPRLQYSYRQGGRMMFEWLSLTKGVLVTQHSKEPWRSKVCSLVHVSVMHYVIIFIKFKYLALAVAMTIHSPSWTYSRDKFSYWCTLVCVFAKACILHVLRDYGISIINRQCIRWLFSVLQEQLPYQVPQDLQYSLVVSMLQVSLLIFAISCFFTM